MKYTYTLIASILLFLFTGCEEQYNAADKEMSRQTEQAMQEANAQLGMPAIVNWQERKLAKMIFELRDQEKIITYAYIVSLEGELIFIGKCIGFGLPYSVQYTNPMKRIGDGVNGEIAVIPQPDPNGLFMPEGLSATWLMMIDPETNEPRPVYVEPQIMVSPFPLHRNESE